MTDGMFPISGDVRDPQELRAKELAYEGLAAAVRELVDATLRTKIEPDAVATLTSEVRAIAQQLQTEAHDGPLGLQVCSDGRLRDPGNPVVGRRNALAPPLKVTKDVDAGRAAARFNLGAAYEGPPKHVHGGVLALILDQVLGTVPALVGRPGMTAYLNVTYRRPSPLQHDLTAEAWVEREDGWKTYVRGHILDDQQRVTAEAEGLFIVPKFAREALSHPMSDAGEYEGGQDGWFRPAER